MHYTLRDILAYLLGARFMQHARPAPEPEPDQSSFRTKRWQQGEKEVEEHIRKGEVEEFDSMDEFLSSLA